MSSEQLEEFLRTAVDIIEKNIIFVSLCRVNLLSSQIGSVPILL